MLILGVDPGFAALGWVLLRTIPAKNDAALVVERAGVVRTAPDNARGQLLVSADETRRTREIAVALAPLVASATILCSEALSHGHRNATTAIKIGISWGALVAVAAVSNRAILEVTPASMRKRLGLKAGAGKDELRAAVEARVGPMREHLAAVADSYRVHAFDAAAAAIACLCSDEARLLLALDRERETAAGG